MCLLYLHIIAKNTPAILYLTFPLLQEARGMGAKPALMIHDAHAARVAAVIDER